MIGVAMSTDTLPRGLLSASPNVALCYGPRPTLCLSHASLIFLFVTYLSSSLLFSFFSFSFPSLGCLRAIFLLSKWPASGILLMVVSTSFFRELTHLIVLTTELTLSSYVLYAMPKCRPLILMIVEVQAHRRLVLLAVVHHRPYAPSLAVFYPR